MRKNNKKQYPLQLEFVLNHSQPSLSQQSWLCHRFGQRWQSPVETAWDKKAAATLQLYLWPECDMLRHLSVIQAHTWDHSQVVSLQSENLPIVIRFEVYCQRYAPGLHPPTTDKGKAVRGGKTSEKPSKDFNSNDSNVTPVIYSLADLRNLCSVFVCSLSWSFYVCVLTLLGLHSLPPFSFLGHAHHLPTRPFDWLKQDSGAFLLATPAVRHFVLSRVMSSRKLLPALSKHSKTISSGCF